MRFPRHIPGAVGDFRREYAAPRVDQSWKDSFASPFLRSTGLRLQTTLLQLVLLLPEGPQGLQTEHLGFGHHSRPKLVTAEAPLEHA